MALEHCTDIIQLRTKPGSAARAEHHLCSLPQLARKPNSRTLPEKRVELFVADRPCAIHVDLLKDGIDVHVGSVEPELARRSSKLFLFYGPRSVDVPLEEDVQHPILPKGHQRPP